MLKVAIKDHVDRDRVYGMRDMPFPPSLGHFIEIDKGAVIVHTSTKSGGQTTSQ